MMANRWAENNTYTKEKNHNDSTSSKCPATDFLSCLMIVCCRYGRENDRKNCKSNRKKSVYPTAMFATWNAATHHCYHLLLNVFNVYNNLIKWKCLAWKIAFICSVICSRVKVLKKSELLLQQQQHQRPPGDKTFLPPLLLLARTLIGDAYHLFSNHFALPFCFLSYFPAILSVQWFCLLFRLHFHFKLVLFSLFFHSESVGCINSVAIWVRSVQVTMNVFFCQVIELKIHWIESGLKGK